MPRLSIDLTERQHFQLKTIAAINGQSIKEFVLSRTFADLPQSEDSSEEEALQVLRDFLEQRMQQVRDGDTVVRSASDINQRARQIRGGDV